jgi:hypothetical protein
MGQAIRAIAANVFCCMYVYGLRPFQAKRFHESAEDKAQEVSGYKIAPYSTVMGPNCGAAELICTTLFLG